MKLERKKLLDVLKVVKLGLAKEDLVGQSSSFVFTGETVHTFSDEIMISHPLETEFTGAVEGKELHDILSKMKEEQVNVEVVDGELLIKGKKRKAGIRMYEASDLPENMADSVSKLKWKKLPANFIEQAKRAMFCVSKSSALLTLTCIHCKDDIVESCDNMRMLRCEMKGSLDDELLIPGNVVGELIKIAPKDLKEYALKKNWIHFKLPDGAIFSSRLIDGNFPDLDRILEDDKGKTVSFPKELKSILDKAAVFTSSQEGESGELVEISFDKDSFTLKGEGNTGWYEEEGEVEYKGKLFSFHVNINFLKEIAGSMDKAIVGKDKLRLEGKGFTHVVVLLAR